MGIYVVRCEESNYYKIGKTDDIKKRLSGLQVGCPYRLVLIHYYDKQNSDLIEKHLHNKYRDYEIRGEWFNIGVIINDVLGYIDKVSEDTIDTEEIITYKCEKCGKEFTRKITLDYHKDYVCNGKIHKCHKCKKIFRSDGTLKRHIRSCVGELKCDKCDRKFTTKNRYMGHIENCGNFKCNICSKEFKSKNRYEFHIENCGEYECSICRKQYTIKKNYERHLRKCL